MRESMEADREGARGRSNGSSGHSGRSSGTGRISGAKAVQAAKENLEELTSQPCEAVSSLVRTREGWAVTLEVVELERVPRSTDILASYRVEIDNEGELMGYERIHRYYRNQAGGE
jgi:hypothetical protein